MDTLGITRLDGETWRECAERYAYRYGLQEDVLSTYDRISPGDPDNGDAAWMACADWDLLDLYRSGRH